MKIVIIMMEGKEENHNVEAVEKLAPIQKPIRNMSENLASLLNWMLF